MRECPQKANGSCKLRGKAGEIRHIEPVIAKLWEQHHNPKLRIHRLIMDTLQASINMEAILDANKECYALPGVCFCV